MSDVFGLTSGLQVLIDAGVVRQFTAANGEELPPQYRDPDRYWVSSHRFVLTPGINTSLVPAAQRPRSYDDLLAPAWKDKIIWKQNDLSGAPGFIGNVLTFMGEERGMDEHQDGQCQRPRHPRPGDRGRASTRLADFQPSCRDQRREGRAGQLAAPESGDRHAPSGGPDQKCAASQCAAAIHRLHDRQGRPANFPEGE